MSLRLHVHGTSIERARAQRLADEAFTDVVILDDFDEVDLHEGSLTIEGDLSVEGALFVRGDLVVLGELAEDDGALLLVTGAIRCRRANLRGGGVCEGAFVAEEWVYANSGNDHGWSMGRLSAKVFVEGGTATFATHMDTIVWRTMNVVRSMVDGQRVDHPKMTRAAMTDDAWLALGLETEALDELRALVD